MKGRNLICVTAAVVIAAACDSDEISAVDRDLDTVRAMTTYNTVAAANAAGYTTWSPDPNVQGSACATDPAGKMGYHLVNVPLRGSAADPANGDAVIDQNRPEMLLYEKRADGTVRLAGVEYIVFRDAWERVNGANAPPPQVFGQPLLFSSHSFVTNGPSIPHYELHVWLHSTNPNGMFAPWNPAITC